MAAGSINQVLDDLASLAVISLKDEGLGALSEEDRNVVLQDYEFAKSYAQFALVTKLNHWQELPWVIVAMTHPITSVARQMAETALEMFDQSLSRII